MAADGDNIIWFTYTGAERELIPDEATHILVLARVVRARAFFMHHNIIEVICDEMVEKIEERAFDDCTSLRRVIMPGVKIVEKYAFWNCSALEDVECDKLEIVGHSAFGWCVSLRSINLPSARFVKNKAFGICFALTYVKFGSKLERIEEGAFRNCDLERITIPLKDGLITNHYNIFQHCNNLHQVDLIEGELHETISALHLEDWRNDMNEEIDSINQTLPNALACYYISDDEESPCEKAQAIRRWIRSVLHKIIHYQEEHQRLLNEAATVLQLVLPNDIVMDNVLPFLELPSYTFQVGDDEDEDDSDNDTQLVELLRIDDRDDEEE